MSVRAEPIHGGIVPIAMTQAGLWARLSHSEPRVLAVICSHASAFTGTASLSISTVAREAGVSPRTAERAIKRLELKRVLHVTGGGGRRSGGGGRANVYRVETDPVAAGLSPAEEPRHPGDGVSASKPRHPGDGVSAGKPRHLASDTPSPR